MEEMMKTTKKYREVKKIIMNEGDSLNQINYIKYKKEENMKKALLGIKAQDNHNRGKENKYDGGRRGRTYL